MNGKVGKILCNSFSPLFILFGNFDIPYYSTQSKIRVTFGGWLANGKGIVREQGHCQTQFAHSVEKQGIYQRDVQHDI